MTCSTYSGNVSRQQERTARPVHLQNSHGRSRESFLQQPQTAKSPRQPIKEARLCLTTNRSRGNDIAHGANPHEGVSHIHTNMSNNPPICIPGAWPAHATGSSPLSGPIRAIGLRERPASYQQVGTFCGGSNSRTRHTLVHLQHRKRHPHPSPSSAGDALAPTGLRLVETHASALALGAVSGGFASRLGGLSSTALPQRRRGSRRRWCLWF